MHPILCYLCQLSGWQHCTAEVLQHFCTLPKNPYLEYEYEGFINLKVSICFLYFNIYFYSKFLKTLKSSLFFDIFKVYNYKKGFEVEMFSLNLSNEQDKQKINFEKYSQLAKYAQTADHSSQSKPGVSIY